MTGFGQLIRSTHIIHPTQASGDLRDMLNASLRTTPDASLDSIDPALIRRPRAILVSLVLDDSGSMKHFIDAENIQRDGQKTVIRCCNGMLNQMVAQDNPRLAIILGVWGFKGMIQNYQFPKQVAPFDESRYIPDTGTPLFDTMGDCMTFSGQKRLEIQTRGIPCAEAFLFLSDGQERDSSRFEGEQVRSMIAQKLTVRGNLVFGIGLGPAGCQQLRAIGIPQPMIRDVSKSFSLDQIFREFTTMTTQSGGGVSLRGFSGGMTTDDD